jgi:hypothetical protein
MKKILFAIVLFIFISEVNAQAGISVSPGRLYYKLAEGGSGSQRVSLTNPTDREVEVGVSFSDWGYEPSGINLITDANTLPTSCVNWIQISPASYFVLKPYETKDVEVLFKVPPTADTNVPVHTAMIFFTQLNPGKTTGENGAAIQVTVRMGVKVYHSFQQKTDSALEIDDFGSFADESGNKFIELKVANQGKIWADGKVKWELFNNTNGKKSSLSETDFYTLPNDIRVIQQALPGNLEKGNYTISAIVTYGESDTIKIAELEFTL